MLTSCDIEQMRNIVLTAETEFRNATEELNYCDKKTQDILHEMELLDHSYHETAHLATELRDIRRRRRVAKNTIERLEPVVRWKNEQAGAMNKLSNVIGIMRKIEEKHNSQVYYHRADDKAGQIIGHEERAS